MRIKLNGFQYNNTLLVEHPDFPVIGKGTTLEKAMMDFAQQMIKLNKEKPDDGIAYLFATSSVSQKYSGIPHNKRK